MQNCRIYLFSSVHFSLPTPILRFLYGMPLILSIGLAFFSQTVADPKNKLLNIFVITCMVRNNAIIWACLSNENSSTHLKTIVESAIESCVWDQFYDSCINGECRDPCYLFKSQKILCALKLQFLFYMYIYILVKM